MILRGKKIICLVEDQFEDNELWYPVYRLREEGAQVDLVGTEAITYYGKYGVPCKATYAKHEVKADDYDGMIIPGGWAPDKLRRYPEFVNMVKQMHADQKPIGHICHAGWMWVSAKILQGKTVTGTPAIKDDMEAAGATFVDKPAVIDGNLVSSRRPDDLPQYMRAYISLFKS